MQPALLFAQKATGKPNEVAPDFDHETERIE
jgi:hypothetical protein